LILDCRFGGLHEGVFRRNLDGRIDRYWTDDQSWNIGRGRVFAMLLDRQGTLWAGTTGGLWAMRPPYVAASALRVLGKPGE
jgi:ligand-binding sensor domain-containing protein